MWMNWPPYTTNLLTPAYTILKEWWFLLNESLSFRTWLKRCHSVSSPQICLVRINRGLDCIIRLKLMRIEKNKRMLCCFWVWILVIFTVIWGRGSNDQTHHTKRHCTYKSIYDTMVIMRACTHALSIKYQKFTVYLQ